MRSISIVTKVPAKRATRHNGCGLRERCLKHTFLFEPAAWSVVGTFWAGDRRPVDAEGRIEISHRDTCWLLAGSMKVLSCPPVEFVSAYSIELPGGDTTTLKWTAENAMLGKLQGVFSVVGGSILSNFHSADGTYQGTEHLALVDEDNYRACAMLIFNNRKLSSWQVELTRIERRAKDRSMSEGSGARGVRRKAT
jgi:hypothetical protein